MVPTHIDELVRINADGECADLRVSALEFNSVGHRRCSENACARRQEMASIIVGMETDQVAVEDTEEDFASDGKDTVTESNLVVPRKHCGLAHR